MEHVVILPPELVTAREGRPAVTAVVEARDRPGPAYKQGVWTDDVVWIRMGPLLVARATVDIAWKGEYAMLREVRNRTKGTPLYESDSFWAGKPKVGYAVVAQLRQPRFLDAAKLAGPRTYSYDWIVLESERKRQTWLDPKPPESRDAALVSRFRQLTG